MTDTAILGADEESEIPIRMYRPLEAHDLPVLVFYHGGGWTLGTLDSADDLCRAFATETESMVVSVDYRLAPEHPFPAPLEDAIAALEWIREHAARVGGDPDRIGVCGSSAGANLAAAVARWDALEGADVLAQQVLCYPITDHAFDTPSYAENADGPLLTRADMRWFWGQYLRHPVDGANPYASVLQAPSFEGLPPTTVVTCGHDPLRDEGIAYAESLEDGGVPVSHHHYPSLPHGALSLADEVGQSAEAMEKLTDRIRSAF